MALLVLREKWIWNFKTTSLKQFRKKGSEKDTPSCAPKGRSCPLIFQGTVDNQRDTQRGGGYIERKKEKRMNDLSVGETVSSGGSEIIED